MHDRENPGDYSSKDLTLLAAWKSIRTEYCSTILKPFVKRHEGLDKYGTMFGDLWEDMVDSINTKSGPGVDLCYEYKTNKEVLENMGPDELRKRVQSRIYARISYSGIDFPYDGSIDHDDAEKRAVALVKADLVDPVRVFGKDESTKSDKETRIINSISLVDSMVERALCLRAANRFSERWMVGPSAVGIQLKDIGALREFRSRATQYFGSDEVEQNDCRGYEFDFSHGCTQIAYDIECYLDQGCFDNHDDFEWDSVADLREVTFRLARAPSVIVFSDGVVAALHYCWLRSGKFVTSFHGSQVRSALVSCAMKHAINYGMTKEKNPIVRAKSNGDDCLNRNPGLDLAPAYLDFGFVITDRRSSKGSDPWSFCSHLIFEGVHYPESVAKLLLSLFRHRVVTPELFDQFCYEVKDRPDFAEIVKFVEEVITEAELVSDESSSDGNAET